jgi:uncharacterized membrane protein
MTIKTLVFTALITLTPIFELRGAIPYALAFDVPILLAFILCVVLNALIGPLLFLFLNTAHKLLFHLAWYQKLFDRLVDRARRKVADKVDKYGYLGLALFVAIPLPITGAYTGTLGAWVLGMDPKKTFLAVALGALIAGIIVTGVVILGIEAFSFFVKEVSV